MHLHSVIVLHTAVPHNGGRAKPRGLCISQARTRCCVTYIPISRAVKRSDVLIALLFETILFIVFKFLSEK